MKKILMLTLAVALLAGVRASAASMEDVDGGVGVKLGWFQIDDETETFGGVGSAGMNFDAALSYQVDYDWYVDGGNGAWNLSLLFTSADVSTTGLIAGFEGDADLWQLAVNRKWYLDTQAAGPHTGWYLGGGLGYSSAKVSLSDNTGTTVSSSDTSLDINTLAGYEWPCGGLAEMLWVVDESSLGLSVGYRF